MANIEETLQERGKRYGSFMVHAQVTQALKDAAFANTPTGAHLAADQKEALDMIFHKSAASLPATRTISIAGTILPATQRLSSDGCSPSKKKLAKCHESDQVAVAELLQVLKMRLRRVRGGSNVPAT